MRYPVRRPDAAAAGQTSLVLDAEGRFCLHFGLFYKQTLVRLSHILSGNTRIAGAACQVFVMMEPARGGIRKIVAQYGHLLRGVADISICGGRRIISFGVCGLPLL